MSNGANNGVESSGVDNVVTSSSRSKKIIGKTGSNTSDISLRVIYTEFDTSIAQSYVFHSETGVSVLYDPFQSRYWIAQYDPEELHGDIDKTVFDLVNTLELREGMAHLELPDERLYVARRVNFSQEAQDAFERIMMHCREGKGNKILTHGDKSWLDSIVSQFVEYKHGVSYGQLKPITGEMLH